MKKFLLPLFLIFCCSIDLSVSCAEQDQNGSPFKRIAIKQEFENSTNRKVIEITIKNLQTNADRLGKLFESTAIQQTMSSRHMLSQAQFLKAEISNEKIKLSSTSPTMLYAKYLQDVLDGKDEATMKWHAIQAIKTLRKSITSDLKGCTKAGRLFISDKCQSDYQTALDTITQNESTESPYKYGIRSLENLNLLKNSIEEKAAKLKTIRDKLDWIFRFAKPEDRTLIE